jgi:hypothetical protein
VDGSSNTRVNVPEMLSASLQFTNILKAIRKGEANIYPQAVTNSMIGNVHTGNTLLLINLVILDHETEFEKWELHSPPNQARSTDIDPLNEWVSTIIWGGQLYVPEFRTMISRQTRNWNQDLQQFPAYLMAMLLDDNSSGRFV